MENLPGITQEHCCGGLAMSQYPPSHTKEFLTEQHTLSELILLCENKYSNWLNWYLRTRSSEVSRTPQESKAYKVSWEWAVNILWGRPCCLIVIQLKNHEIEQHRPGLTSSCLSPPPRMALTSERRETPGLGWRLKLQVHMLGHACSDSDCSEHTLLPWVPAPPPPNGTQCFQGLLIPLSHLWSRACWFSF